jgi:hypothetical protein
MEQYPIPQFIEQEGKIAFFISFRQFFYLIGAGVLCFFLFYLLPFFLFAIFSIIIFVISLVLAFGKINGMPILDIILSSFGFLAGSKNYIWQKKESPYPYKTIKRIEIRKIEEGPVLRTQNSQLRKMHTQIETRSENK